MSMRILVATDGTEAASGALHIAGALAERHRAAVKVVSVVEPLPMHSVVYAETMAIAQRQLEEARCMAMQRHLQDTLAALGGDAAAWPIVVESGSPAPTIARRARDQAATLIVMGLGRHAVVDRWFGSETALRTIRLAHVPVLAVAAGARTLPALGVAAVDFSAFSNDAARTALQILAPGGTLHLAHVLWKPVGETAWVGGSYRPELQRLQLREQLEDLADRLETDAGAPVEVHSLEGDAAREMLRLAESLGADLIAAGSHGAGFFGRILIGSVSTCLVRSAKQMVLIAPPREVPVELQAEAPAIGTTAPAERLFAGTTSAVE
jgi:nucleotide-binding universal stress UspA family protein